MNSRKLYGKWSGSYLLGMINSLTKVEEKDGLIMRNNIEALEIRVQKVKDP
jgi:hypothetical protein